MNIGDREIINSICTLDKKLTNISETPFLRERTKPVLRRASLAFNTKSVQIEQPGDFLILSSIA